MLWSNWLYVFYMLLIVDLSSFDLDITRRDALEEMHIHTKKMLWRVKNMPRLGSFSPRFQFLSFFIYIVIDWTFKIHRKCWCKYKWSSNRAVESSECPLWKIYGALEGSGSKQKKNDTNKIGVFSILSFEGRIIRMGDQWELMIKGKFILLNSCPNRENSAKGTSHKFSSFSFFLWIIFFLSNWIWICWQSFGWDFVKIPIGDCLLMMSCWV